MALPPLPPLHFLPTVEAAARLGSFRAAAAELHLTPSAVSQQVRAVEETLGAPLFERVRPRVRLTPEGTAYCRELRRVLLELADAGRLHRRGSPAVMRLSTLDFLAYEFLIPRLPAFQTRFAGIDLRIETSARAVDLMDSDVDAALRICGAPGPGLTALPVGEVIMTPICSAQLARRLHGPDDLVGETLIEMRDGGGEGFWEMALRYHGVDCKQLNTLVLEGYFETVMAAARGLGVAEGLFPLLTQWVVDERLAVPFPVRSQIGGGAHLVFRANDRRRALLSEVAEWLREQYAQLTPLPPGRVEPARA